MEDISCRLTNLHYTVVKHGKLPIIIDKIK